MSQVRDRFAEINGLRLHFRDWDGPSLDAPVLVLLHGRTRDARTWDLFAPMFATRYRVIVSDARGHGESDWSSAREYAPAHQASDVTQLLAALGCDHVSILGHSMGGLTAYAVAAQSPELVDKLVVVDVSPELPESRLGRPPVKRLASFEEALAVQIARPRDEHDVLLREAVRRNLLLMGDGTFSWRFDAEGLRESFLLRNTDDEWRQLEQIKTPTLLVRGADSELLTRELAERVCRSIPNSNLIDVPDAGHPVPRDQPARFFAVVVPFLFD
jgi:pimeloyl-ACP methyl ester carboxylesterase